MKQRGGGGGGYTPTLFKGHPSSKDLSLMYQLKDSAFLCPHHYTGASGPTQTTLPVTTS